jgi:hypothetical protein
VGIGQSDNLPTVGRISEDFLVAGQAGVEDDFTGSPAGGADRSSGEPTTVFKNQPSFHVRTRRILAPIRSQREHFMLLWYPTLCPVLMDCLRPKCDANIDIYCFT